MASRSLPARKPSAAACPDGPNSGFIAASGPMRKLCAQVAQIAKTDAPVLLQGECGTGRAATAALIHRVSARASFRFLSVNCAASSFVELEAELFAGEVGTGPGNTAAKLGKFDLCQHGTLLLQEVAELPLSLQDRLMRILGGKELLHFGTHAAISADVRLLATTSTDLRRYVIHRRFRDDLYRRLRAHTISLPPLRERLEDVPLLLDHFMRVHAREYGRPLLPLSSQLVTACVRYYWPGNLRELENLAKRHLILGDESLILSELSPGELALEAESAEPGDPVGLPPTDLKALVRGLKDEAEKESICRALNECCWNRTEAARLLKISYRAMLYKIRQYGIGQSNDAAPGRLHRLDKLVAGDQRGIRHSCPYCAA